MAYLNKAKNPIINIIVLLTLLNCSVDRTDPNAVLNRYIKATNSSDYKTAYSLLSQQDQNSVSQEEYAHSDSYVSTYISKYTNYSILAPNYSETKQTVTYTVQMNYIDLLTLYAKVPLLTKPNLTNKELNKILSENKKSFDLCRKSNETKFTLILNGKNWEISANLANIKYVRQLRNQVLAYEKTADFDQALEIIDRIYNQGAITEEMTNAYIRINEKKNYIENSLPIQRIFTDTSARLNVTNTGTYAVKGIDVVITYIRDGQPVTSNQSMQLKDGDFLGHGAKYTFYVDFGCSIMSISKLDVKIINVEF